MRPTYFAEKLQILLKTLSLSRAGLAAGLNVDKSLVGRWASGAVIPSEHNLSLLTQFIAERVDGFTMLEWEKDLPAFSERLGITTGTGQPSSMAGWIPDVLIEEATRGAKRRATAYDGIWRSTRSSSDLPGRFLHDITLIRSEDSGIIEFSSGIEGVRYHGRAMLLQHQLFSIAADEDAVTMMLGIFNGVARQKAEVLDGLSVATLRDAGSSPACSAVVMHRISDLTGDRNSDLALFEASVTAQNPLAPEGSVSQDIIDHLANTTTPDAPGLMRMFFQNSMARGPLLDPASAG
jgi:transcriptional regulator with XRE-family HTH domain